MMHLRVSGNTSSVDADLKEPGASLFQLENPLRSHRFNGGAVFSIAPGIGTVPFGSFGFLDPR